jgi:hypothetical protein
LARFDFEEWFRDVAAGIINGAAAGALSGVIFPGPGSVLGAAAGAVLGFAQGAMKYPLKVFFRTEREQHEERERQEQNEAMRQMQERLRNELAALEEERRNVAEAKRLIEAEKRKQP